MGRVGREAWWSIRAIRSGRETRAAVAPPFKFGPIFGIDVSFDLQTDYEKDNFPSFSLQRNPREHNVNSLVVGDKLEAFHYLYGVVCNRKCKLKKRLFFNLEFGLRSLT